MCHPQQQSLGIKGPARDLLTRVLYGAQYADPTNPDTWHHYNLHHASMVVSCGHGTTESDCVLAADLKQHSVPFLCIADSNAEARVLYDHGARFARAFSFLFFLPPRSRSRTRPLSHTLASLLLPPSGSRAQPLSHTLSRSLFVTLPRPEAPNLDRPLPNPKPYTSNPEP